MVKASKKSIFIILISFLVLVSGCFYIETPVPPSVPTPAPAPAPAPAPNITAPVDPGWTLPPTSQPSEVLPDFVSVVARVKPSVVAITTEVTTYDIFNRPFKQEGAGSGWIIDKDGYIVTNNHVIEGASIITVTFSDEKSVVAAVVGADALSDVAVLKVAETNLPTVVRGDSSQLRIGEWVLAIGNALGLGISAKEGIVSRLGASVPVSAGQTLDDLIETSAPINPGNSGGPLVNMAGEVIGITSAKLADVAVEGLGFAISINSARPIIEGLIQKGYVVRPYLGVSHTTVNQFLVMRYNLAVETGAFIAAVVPDSPAAIAGLQEGDVVVRAGGKDIATDQDLRRAIHSSHIGQQMEITFWRGQTETTTSVLLTESPVP